MSQTKKVALVTGANRGIGLETVRQLALQGIEVFLAARSLTSAQDAAATLTVSGVNGVHPIQLDVTKASDRTAVAKQIESEFGHLDILINNAALGAPGGNFACEINERHPGERAAGRVQYQRFLRTPVDARPASASEKKQCWQNCECIEYDGIAYDAGKP